MKLSRNIKFPTLQKDQSDCGVACLSAIIIYHGGYVELEKLRELSGTTRQGTTLLGLSQAANKIGLKSSGHETILEKLKSIDSPCILHTIIDNNFNHYVVCYGFKKGLFLIGDPAKGMVYLSEKELSEIWVSRILLTLTKTVFFKKAMSGSRGKRKWLKQLVYADISILLIITLLGLIVSFSGIIISIFSQQLVDHILPNANIHKLIIGLVLVSFILLVRSIIGYLRNSLLNVQSREFNNRLINYFYSRLLLLPKGFFNNRKVGELVARMEDTSRIQIVLAFIFGDLIKDVLLTLGSISILFYYSMEVGLLATLFIPVFFLIEKYYHKKIIYHQYEVMNSNARKTSSYINTLSGIDTVKIHNKEETFAITNKLVYGIFQDKVFRLGKVGISLQLLADVVSVTLLMAVLSESAFLVLSKNLQLGEFIAIISITGTMLPSIGNIAFADTRIQGARVAFERMYDFTGLDPEYPEQNHPDGNNKSNSQIIFNSLEFKDVTFRFPGRKAILNNISFEFKFGEIVSLVGESGSGKTCLLNLLQRFYEPDDGLILVNQMPMQNIQIFFWRNTLGVVQQEPSIFNGFLLENICLSSETEDIHLAHKFCSEYGFDKYFNKFPQGYNTPLGDEGLNISGGQKQLIALARALYKKPQVLLLDEPTSSMDKNLEDFVINLLLYLKGQMSIFIITHRMTMTKFADKTFILQDGHIYEKNLANEMNTSVV
ncbi:MAG: peptidase domain-containing ABC transporter [Sphingobacteriia bacterium]|nr:peptidase domain-containing ABC transporter [Sphingobacteriia bacterium]